MINNSVDLKKKWTAIFSYIQRGRQKPRNCLTHRNCKKIFMVVVGGGMFHSVRTAKLPRVISAEIPTRYFLPCGSTSGQPS